MLRGVPSVVTDYITDSDEKINCFFREKLVGSLCYIIYSLLVFFKISHESFNVLFCRKKKK